MTDDTVRDRLLILRCQARDESAFEQLVERWEPRLYYYLRRITRSETDVLDILQETWLAVFKSIRNLQDPAKFPAWLYRLARNQASNWFRKEERLARIENAEVHEDSAPASDSCFAAETADLVHHLLEGLPLPYREVMTLYFLEGFSIKEMADVIEIPEGTVKSRLHHAKNKLREALEETNGV